MLKAGYVRASQLESVISQDHTDRTDEVKLNVLTAQQSRRNQWHNDYIFSLCFVYSVSTLYSSFGKRDVD